LGICQISLAGRPCWLDRFTKSSTPGLLLRWGPCLDG
jgi:hypothetical protein